MEASPIQPGSWRGLAEQVYGEATQFTYSFFAVVVGAFSFACALAWNSALQQTIEASFPAPQDTHKKARYSFFSAVAITLFTLMLVAISQHLNKGKGLALPGLVRDYVGR